jgi:signal transduction histidine kinase
MTKETLLHIFEPFFTTKEPGEAQDWGTAGSGIVKQHGGEIERAAR